MSQTQAQPPSTSFDGDVRGSTVPRVFTPPLRPLTPETSYGFDVITFARDVLKHPLDPWQAWLVIHACELLPDGRPRFRKVLLLVARQNGKTETLVILMLYWQFVEALPLILSTSNKLQYAKETWQKTVDLAERAPLLDGLHPKKWTAGGNGSETAKTYDGSRHKISAANDSAGRSLTVHRLVLDELRKHQTYACWDAAVYAMNAVRDAQVWCVSNAGDDTSLVLNDLQAAATEFIETGEGDDRLGIFEWSAEEDDDPLDVAALAKANPNLGYRLDAYSLLGDAKRAVAQGGEVLTGFKTESMCIRVRKMNPAINERDWRECADPGNLDGFRDRLTLCLDVAPDQMHASLVIAAVVDDDRVRVEVVKAWEGYGCTADVRRSLPKIVERIRPRKFGWFPSGPAAALTAALVENGRHWPPNGVTVEEIRGDLAAACMGLAEQVKSHQIVHSEQPLLNDHITNAEKLKRGDVWVFSRKGEGHCDAAYGAAGAVHLARTLPASIGKPRLVIAQ